METFIFRPYVGWVGGFLVVDTYYIVEDSAIMDEAKGNHEPGGEVAEKSNSSSSRADAVFQSASNEVEDMTSATSAPAGAIRPIDRGVVHQICSGQV